MISFRCSFSSRICTTDFCILYYYIELHLAVFWIHSYIFWLVRIYGFAVGREMLNTRVFLIDRHLPRR